MKKRKTVKIEIDVGFPYGSVAEITEYITCLEKEFINETLPTHRDIQTGEYVLKSITFQDKWYGYEDHEFLLVAELEETDEVYNTRLEAERVRKLKEAEELKKRQEANLRKKEEKRQKEIRDLEAKLKELRGE